MIVVDASAVLEILLPTSGALIAQDWIFTPGQTLHAPHLIDLEVTQVVRRHVANRRIEEDVGRGALASLLDLPITRYPHSTLLDRVWALKGNLSAYDAAYVALAEMLDAPLVTRDKRLASAPGHNAKITLV
jgi:predicted nucleic acid-binding protein